ncbi:MAG TPA: hypothetical protein P5556_04585 [Candidatus Gastranaerophilales bacterium]|nr:hypothetical protein [Candidatus Gastranaerophilales bacterium]
MLKNRKFKELAVQYINKYKLNLEGYNVLVPMMEQEPCLLAAIAGLAGACRVYMFNPKITVNQKIESVDSELNFNINVIGGISLEILSGLNIILKNSKIPLKQDKMACFSKKSSVISMFPENLDFINMQNIEKELLDNKDLSIIGLDPENQSISLYQQFAHVVVKRCYQLGIDVLKSKILLIGHGDLLNCSLSLLKSTGAIVYAYNVFSESDQSYILKHLKELDAIIVMDYPQTSRQIIGSKGVISISDIVDQCPLVKVIHISGKTETASLRLGNISCFPEETSQDSLNTDIKELGERGITELATASFKVAENFLKLRKNALNLNDSVVTYKLLNNKPSLLLGG